MLWVLAMLLEGKLEKEGPSGHCACSFLRRYIPSALHKVAYSNPLSLLTAWRDLHVAFSLSLSQPCCSTGLTKHRALAFGGFLL